MAAGNSADARGAASPRAHPAFATYANWFAPAAGALPPDVDVMNEWAAAAGISVRFVEAERRRVPALDYARRIVERGEVATRPGNLHDFMNALSWLAFPRTKAALARLHVDAPGAAAGARGPARDAATLLDEHGVIVLATDPGLVGLWREHAWQALFGDRASRVMSSMKIAVIGHGLLAKLLAPYPALTAHALVIEVVPGGVRAGAPADDAQAIDGRAAEWLNIRQDRVCPADWLRLPLIGWPGWNVGAAHPVSLSDRRVFRPRASAVAVGPPRQ